MDRGRIDAARGERPTEEMINSAHGSGGAAYMYGYLLSVQHPSEDARMLLAREPDFLAHMRRAAKRRKVHGASEVRRNKKTKK